MPAPLPASPDRTGEGYAGQVAAPARACPTCRVSCAPSSRRSGPRPPAACTWRIGTETDGEGRDKAQIVPARPAPRVTDGPGAKRTGRRAGEEQGRVSAPGREALKCTREARVTSGRSGPASTRALGTAFAAWRLCERTYHPFRCLQCLRWFHPGGSISSGAKSSRLHLCAPSRPLRPLRFGCGYAALRFEVDPGCLARQPITSS